MGLLGLGDAISDAFQMAAGGAGDVTNAALPQFNFGSFNFTDPATGAVLADYALPPGVAAGSDFNWGSDPGYLYGMGRHHMYGMGVAPDEGLLAMTPLKWAALAALGFYFLLPKGAQRNPPIWKKRRKKRGRYKIGALKGMHKRYRKRRRAR